MRTPEGVEKDRVRKYLAERGAYQFWPVQSGFGASALDCYAIFQGRSVIIETKKAGYVPSDFTKRQRIIILQCLDAGALVLVGTADEIIDGHTHGRSNAHKAFPKNQLPL